MKLIDTHCHLDAPEFDTNLGEILQQAQSAGVYLYVIPSTSPTSIKRVKTLCQHHPVCLPAYGIHPYHISQPLDSALADLETALSDGSAIAIGEIGIDLYDKTDTFDRQESYFCAQLDIARHYHLPVLLHMRRAADRVIPLLRRYKIESGIAHAFSGSLEQARQLLKMGFKIGFGGVVTYPTAHKLRYIAAALPDDALVLETDAPFLPPVWLKGRANSPLALPGIADVIASLRGIPVEMLADMTTRNASSVFDLPFTPSER